jgi:uncharacterized protein (DUF885 family)
MNNLLKISLLLLLLGLIFLNGSRKSNFGSLRYDFYNGYTAFNLPGLQVNYTDVLNNIRSKDKIEQQRMFFSKMKSRWVKIDINNLSEKELLDYRIIGYEIDLNLTRINLEYKWDSKIKTDETKSIYSVPNGTKWYAYLLKRWVDKTVTPKELYDFGLSEIQQVKSNMRQLQKASGLTKNQFEQYLESDDFLINKPSEVQESFEIARNIVKKKATEMFPYIDKIPEINIEKGTNQNLSHVPAYYNNNTFYYNLFDEPFNNRQIGWFYVHEAIPGHHYQSSVNQIVNRSRIQNLFWYAGFVEGWGAYVEHLGNELGVYKTLYDEYGKWEWDLIRSVRVCMDIGINYKGWSDKQALEFWETHIQDQEAIALREIGRMKRWPAQVITYKYGAAVFLSLLKEAKKKADFNYIDFHQRILKHGDIPMSLVLQMSKLDHRIG